MALTLDKARLDAIIDAIAERLPGDWLVLGGAIVSVWLDARRTTEDMDVVGLGGTLAERHALLRLAGELGLPVESLNSAADYFLEQIQGWRDELEIWRQGRAGTVWRPSATLLVLLKSGRLSEQDLADCEAAIRRARAENLRLDSERLRHHLDALPPSADPNVEARREQLRALLA